MTHVAHLTHREVPLTRLGRYLSRLGHLTKRGQMTQVAHLTHHVVPMTRLGRVMT